MCGGFGRLTNSTRQVCPTFVPRFNFCSRVGALARYLRVLTSAELPQQCIDTNSGTRGVIGLWALRVYSALQNEDSVAVTGDLLPSPSLPGRQI